MKSVLYCFIIVGAFAALAQESSLRGHQSLVQECYENDYLLQRDNRLPHTMNTLLALLRKIENSENLNMDLRSLSVALLHRFRQDGIRQNPNVPKQDGVTPYAPIGFERFKNLQIQRFVPGNAILFPNNSITAIERCTLHFMLSSSISIFERGDEGTVCRYANNQYRRFKRGFSKENKTGQQMMTDDVETLSPEEIELMTNKEGSVDTGIDPNSLYPELPPNHPAIARMFSLPPRSKCPVENGVLKTQWGPVSGGPILAGVAAGIENQNISLKELNTDDVEKRDTPIGDNAILDNRWIATLSGDLAEIVLRQGPGGKKFILGASGNWNSTTMPRWYFLNTNEYLEFTAAEIRGDLDGLILATQIQSLYSRIPSLRLSQVLDMYYSAQGLFHTSVRACNRRVLFSSVAPIADMTAQAFSASVVLSKFLAKATLDDAIIDKFAGQAVKELSNIVPTMNNDMGCDETDRLDDHNPISTDITIILDTNWPLEQVQPILADLLESVEINPYNSNYTILNGYDGSFMINSTYSILDFYNYNTTHYQNITRGFDLSKTLQNLQIMREYKLNDERSKGLGGERSDVVVILPYTTSISDSDKDYCLQQLRNMRENTPDMTVLILTYGSKDRWSNLVVDSTTDLFSIGTGNTIEALAPLTNVIARIKQVPNRLINSQCGANYESVGSSNSFTDYITPNEVQFYRLHPNYFYSRDTSRSVTVKVQGSGWGNLIVCSSRTALHINATEARKSASCAPVNTNTYTIGVSCGDASYIHTCPPLYLSVSANSTSASYQCTDPRVCRFPTQIKYTISYENLLCVSGSSAITFNIGILTLILVYVLF